MLKKILVLCPENQFISFMRKYLASLVFIFFSLSGFAQKIAELEPMVKTRFPFKIQFKFNDFTYDLAQMYGESGKEVALMDLNTGKPLWHITAKDLGVKDEIYLNYKRIGHCAIKTKGKEPKEFLIDNRSGKVIESEKDSWFGQLSPEEQASLKARQEEMFQATREREEDNFLKLNCATCGQTEAEWNDLKLVFNYPNENNTSAFGSKRDLSVVAKRQDKTLAWKVDFKGFVVRPLCYDFANSGTMFGKNLVSLKVIGDKALALYEGLACIDLAEGKLLWQMDLNNSDVSIGLKAKQTLGLAGKPLVVGQSIILADLTKGNNTIKKIDLNTGQVIWTSEKLANGSALPAFHLHNNLLICQIGGQLERQEFIAGQGISTCKASQFLTEKNDLLVLDMESGKTIWRAEKLFKQYKDSFDKLAITQMANNQLMVVTDKNVLVLDPTTGALQKSLSMDGLKIGSLKFATIMPNSDLFISATAGVARISPQAESKYAANTKANLYLKVERKGIIRVFTGTSGATGSFNKFVLLDSETGEVFGSVDDTPFPYFDADMTSFISFDGSSTIYKYQFRKRP